MNKRIAIYAIFFLALAGAAAAWHCEDTDESQPAFTRLGYGDWGDNGELDGTTSHWLKDDVEVPAGCTGTQGGYVCTDLCDGTTLREFYCTDRPGHLGETVIDWNDYKDSLQCTQVPEFSPVALAAAGIAGIVIFAAARRRQ